MIRLCRWGAVLVLPIMVYGLGCVPTPTVPKPAPSKAPLVSPEVSAEFERGLAAYNRGDRDEAALRFQDFIAHHPRSSLTDDALFYLGTIYLERGECSAAVLQFATLLEQFSSSSLTFDARWSLARCYYALEKYRDAVETALRLVPKLEDRGERKFRLFVFLGNCHARLAEPAEALSWYSKASREIDAPEKPELQEKMMAVLDQELTPEVYRNVDREFAGSPVSTYARYRLSAALAREGRYQEADGILEHVVEEARGEPYFHSVEKLRREVSRAVTGEVVIGCILPLQGKHRTFGLRALRGIQLAMGAFRSRSWPFTVRMVVKDSRGNPSLAQEAVRSLVEEHGVIAIVGPLLTSNALAASEEAEKFGVPLITLSPLRRVAYAGHYVFQNALTPEAHVRTLVEYAVDTLGLLTFAVIYPRNAYGMTFKRLFEEEVERVGGFISAVGSYSEDQTDFRELITTMVEYEPPPPDTPEGKPTPIINFEAIFIPDDARRINLLVPQLAYYDITGVQLLGTGGWNSPELVRNSRDFVEGALFVDGFFRDSPRGVVREFVQEFGVIFKELPGNLEALSFDATHVILTMIERKGAWSGDAIANTLLSMMEYEGVTGLTGFNDEGVSTRHPFLLTVSYGRIRQIVMAP